MNRSDALRSLGCGALLLFVLPAAAATIDAVRVQVTPPNSRVVLDLSQSVRYRLFTLENPHRVVIDVLDAQLRGGLKLAGVPLQGSRIVAIRGGPREAGEYRIVLDVAEHFSPKGSLLAASASAGDQLLIELANSAPAGSPATPARPAAVAAPITRPPRTAATQTGGAIRDFVVAVDAGHGGSDPGAIGVGKIQEKRVALAIAEELSRLIDAAPGYRSVLVRSGDYYLTLRQRTAVARRQRADLFISIHADAFSTSAARGASVYALSAKGATSETARWLAEKENASDLIGGVGEVSLDDKDALLAHVLLDLSMDANRSASIEAGAAVLTALGGVAQLHRKRVEQAGFVVLKSPDIPSILVETGYLSNAVEARALGQPAHRRKIARAIFTGITAYVARHPRPDILLAARGSAGDATEHVIKRGDTLSDIAAYYRVSRLRLRQANGLANDIIRVGQVLIIPSS